MYTLFADTQNVVSEIEKVAGVKLAVSKKGVGEMLDYDARVSEVVKEKDREIVRRSVRIYRSFKQEPAVTRLKILDEYPDTDETLLDKIIAEVYGL